MSRATVKNKEDVKSTEFSLYNVAYCSEFGCTSITSPPRLWTEVSENTLRAYSLVRRCPFKLMYFRIAM